MPRFEPFRGLRYDPERFPLSEVAAPPYDVIDEELRAELVARHPRNAVRIDLPVAEGGLGPYEVAPSLLDAWQGDRTLIRDVEPSFYVYAMSFRDASGIARETRGVLGALALSRPGEGGILPHEHTTPKARSDRLEMLRVCRANLSAVWGLSPAAGLSDLLADPGGAVADWVDDGVRHRLWRQHDPAGCEAISAAVGAVPFIIADGHHRYETSLAYRDEQSTAGPPSAGSVLAYTVELIEENVSVLPIHRLITAPSAGLVRAHLLRSFAESESGPIDQLDATRAAALADAGHLVLVTAETFTALRPDPARFADVRDLDSVRLEVALAGLDGTEVSYQHGVDHVIRRVCKGDAPTGVLLRPATVPQILEIADGGQRMPPKTTFFHPKVRTGLVFRLLD